MSDEEIVQAVARADQRVMNQLYDRLYPSVDRTLSRVLGRRDDDYNDLIQVVFERVIESIINGRFDGRCRLTTWASAIASHVGVDEIRARQRYRRFFSENPEVHPEEGDPIDPSVEGRLEARSTFALVRQALAQLNRNQAQILVLFHLEGYSISEVASVVGLNREACKSKLARARRKFMRVVENLERSGQ